MWKAMAQRKAGEANSWQRFSEAVWVFPQDCQEFGTAMAVCRADQLHHEAPVLSCVSVTDRALAGCGRWAITWNVTV